MSSFVNVAGMQGFLHIDIWCIKQWGTFSSCNIASGLAGLVLFSSKYRNLYVVSQAKGNIHYGAVCFGFIRYHSSQKILILVEVYFKNHPILSLVHNCVSLFFGFPNVIILLVLHQLEICADPFVAYFEFGHMTSLANNSRDIHLFHSHLTRELHHDPLKMVVTVLSKLWLAYIFF